MGWGTWLHRDSLDWCDEDSDHNDHCDGICDDNGQSQNLNWSLAGLKCRSTMAASTRVCCIEMSDIFFSEPVAWLVDDIGMRTKMAGVRDPLPSDMASRFGTNQRPATSHQKGKVDCGFFPEQLFCKLSSFVQFCHTGPNNHKSPKEETPIFGQVYSGINFLAKTIRFLPKVKWIDSLLLWIRQNFLTFFHNFAKQLPASITVPSMVVENIWMHLGNHQASSNLKSQMRFCSGFGALSALCHSFIF